MPVTNSTFIQAAGAQRKPALGTHVEQASLDLVGEREADAQALSALVAREDVTDLSPLFGLRNLTRVELSDCTGLTAAEIDKLRAALPGCEIA